MDWSFNKRASRSEFWFFALAMLLVSVSPIALRIVFWLIGNEGAAWLADSGTAQAVLTVVSLSHIVVLFFCQVVLFKIWVKRMHDRGVDTGALLGRALVYVALGGAVYLATLGVFNFPSRTETLLQLLLLAALLWNVVEVSLPGHRHTNRYNVADPTTL